MAHYKYILFCLSLLFLCTQCDKEVKVQPSLVVEGWIAQDKHPIVMLHESYVTSSLKDTNSFADILEKQLIIFGKITLSDGENEVVLRGKVDTNFMPPYIYTDYDMVGEVGKTYTIHVEYEPYDLWASTTIQPSTPVDSVQVVVVNSQYVNVWVHLNQLPPNKTYYAIFHRKLGIGQYQLCPLGLFTSEDAIHGHIKQLVKQPINLGKIQIDDIGHGFSRDTVAQSHFIRVVQLSEEEYKYWTAFDGQILTQGIFFVNVYHNLPSVLPNNAYGYWQGWGGEEYEFFTNKDSTFTYKHR